MNLPQIAGYSKCDRESFCALPCLSFPRVWSACARGIPEYGSLSAAATREGDTQGGLDEKEATRSDLIAQIRCLPLLQNLR
jgi:hypothetical protein